MTIIELAEGQTAKVINIEGGFGCRRRLESLGIRQGIHIQKIRGLFTHGPIIVKAGRTQIALGKGMAAKVSVELIKE